MKISIITCTYNRLEKLKKNIQSVKNQSFKDYEHIILDDGSTDDTEKYFQKNKQKNIFYFRSKINGGQPYIAHKFKIFNKISGDYYFFLDSDDFLLDNFYRTLKKDLKKIKNKNICSINYSFANSIYKKNKDKINYKKYNSKEILQDYHPRNIGNKGFVDFLSVKNKRFLSLQKKYFKKPSDWYLSYFKSCLNYNFEEIYTNNVTYFMSFDSDCVTRGNNIEKYSKWTMHSREVIYFKFKKFMGTKYLNFAIRSLFMNYIVNKKNFFKKIILIKNEKTFFYKNLNLIFLFILTIFLPSIFFLKIKKFIKHIKKNR